MLAFVVFLRRTIRARIVLVAVDVAAYLMLLMIHLSAFTLRQMPTIRGAVVTHFLVDVRFLVLEVARLARRQLARADALSDTSLLVALTFVHAAVRCVRRASMIFGREVCVVQSRAMFVRGLQRSALNVLLVAGAYFLRVFPAVDSAWATVEAGANVVVNNHGAVDIDVAHDGRIHANDRGVVRETPATPFTADEADASVAEAVVNTTVKADMRSPISSVPRI